MDVMRPLVAVRGLNRRFGARVVLRNLDLEVGRGEFVALLGPNGAGKTTLLRILAALARPGIGEVRVGDCRLPQQAGAVRSQIGVVLHQPLLYSELSGEENLRFYGRMYAVANLEERLREVLGMVGLTGRGGERVRTYSRGMQQRLAIGRAVLHEPDLLLLDEPHTGLDREAGAMLDEILRQVTARGRTVLMTSHDLERVENLAGRFDVISGGRIVASASRGDVQKTGLQAFYRAALAGKAA